MQGWCTFVLDDQFKVEGIAVRKTTLGRLALSFPFRQDSFGRRWRYLHPITDQARRSVENQVLALLDLNREFTQ
jgi:DNA-binding cell septation regulator SpoVG